MEKYDDFKKNIQILGKFTDEGKNLEDKESEAIPRLELGVVKKDSEIASIVRDRIVNH